MHYEKNSVGAIMEFGVITVRPDVTLGTVQRYLRRLGKMPDNTDKLFVTSRDKTLLGELELKTILLNSTQRRVSEVMENEPMVFSPKTMRKKRRVPSNVTTWSVPPCGFRRQTDGASDHR
jgi:magnesium transporter